MSDTDDNLTQCFVCNHGGIDWDSYSDCCEELESKSIDHDAAAAYIGWAGQWDASHFEDSYVGQFDNPERELVDEWIELMEVPEQLEFYIDRDAVWRDLSISDYYVADDNHVFRSC